MVSSGCKGTLLECVHPGGRSGVNPIDDAVSAQALVGGRWWVVVRMFMLFVVCPVNIL